MKPLEDLIVLEFCQYMAGPSAGLRLADLGARVIKIERPGTGEGGRRIAIKNLFSGDDSIVFHTINRNKESYTADLKDPEDLEKVKKLVEQVDVLMHSFRPGTMHQFGLDYESVQKINPDLIYGSISGYGSKGPWASKPGQDLLIQSMSGLTYLTGDRDDSPVPFGISVTDMLSGAHLAQGILAALIKRGKTDKGAHVEISLMKSALDLQFEVITTYLNDGGKLPQRAEKGNAHAYLSAPYGIYQTKDSYIAIAMEDLHNLGEKIGCKKLLDYSEDEWFTKRNEIMSQIENTLQKRTTDTWLQVLEPADIWCADVFGYQKLTNHEAYKVLQMEQELNLYNGETLRTTRCPIRIDGKRLFNTMPAPDVGMHTASIDKEFDL